MNETIYESNSLICISIISKYEEQSNTQERKGKEGQSHLIAK